MHSWLIMISKGVDMCNEKQNFGRYLITVGMRAAEFTYSDEIIFQHIQYFKECFEKNLSAYKALLFLHDFLISPPTPPQK